MPPPSHPPCTHNKTTGDVATWSGVVTGGLMLLSPLLFERLGWRGVANATPTILLYGGSAFFLACIVYQVCLCVCLCSSVM